MENHTENLTGAGNLSAVRYGKNSYSRKDILQARHYWRYLSLEDLGAFWRIDRAKDGGEFAGYSFWDWLVCSAYSSSFQRSHDI